MFTEGLNTDALRWVRETHRIDPISSGRAGGGRGGGLPPVSKFRTGHLPTGAIHVSRSIHDYADDTGSGSDDDLTTDTEEEVYGGRYSLDSSPQTDRISNGDFAQKYIKPLQSRPHYASDYMYSDVSSSMETVNDRKGNVAEKFVRGNGGCQARSHGFMEEESSDSAGSSEFSSTQVGIKNGTASRAYGSDGYASTVPSRFNAKVSVKKNNAINRQIDELSDDEDVPSAPPLHDTAQEIKQGSEKVPASGVESMPRGTDVKDFSTRNDSANTDVEAPISSSSLPGRLPTFRASALGPWHSVIAYESCVRLCLHAWSVGSMEAPMFMENECALLREAFCLQQVLLQPEEELLAKRTSELVTEGSAAKPKKIIGKMKVQVRKVKMALDPPTGCSMASIRVPSIKLETIQYGISNMQTTVSSRWKALRKTCATTRLPSKSSFSRQQLVHTSSRYLKQVSGLLKIGVTTLRNSSSSYEAVQETYSCSLRMKSSVEEDTVRMQPGSGETHVFFPDSLGDDLIIEIQDSSGKQYGRVVSQVATISEDPADKLRWWSIFHEPDHELVGKIQLYINYSTSYDENNLKCGSVAETVAYDILLEVVMKVQHFQQRNLRLHGHWNWLLIEFAKYYGVSNIYSKLRYLSYIMDVATPTADCLNLVYDQLLPVVMKGKTLSHQENRIFGEIKEQLEQILALLFENYKSLDESSLSGMMEVFRPATGLAAPALEPAVKLYTLLHDILSPEGQTTLCQYFQAAAKKRSRRHLAETDEFVTNSSNTEGPLMDTLAISTAYQKMKSVCLNIKNEIYTDIEIHEQHILPSFIDLPNLSSSIYNTELCSRLRAFLIACPPPGPSPFVAELVIVTSDFQRDLTNWNISPVKGGVDAKELFHLYIILWIQDKRLSLLDSCKLDKVKWSGVRTQHSTTPFVDDMYERLKETLTDYEVIICRWPEYTFLLENAIADIEKAIVEALDKQYADVLSPLKENLAPKMFGLQYVQKLAKRSTCPYVVPDEVGILLNSMKRMLDVLRPKIETQFKLWGSCIPDNGNTAPGERLSEVTVMLRAKFRNYLQAIVEKLSENTKSQNSTKLKKILQDSKENVVESDVRSRMQPLKDQLRSTINHLHTVFETHVFIAICKGYWDRMGQDVLGFLENRKENRSWYKGARVAVSVLDDIFASQMQQLLGNSLQEKDIEPPRSIMEVSAILCKDAPDHKDNRYYY